MVINILIRTSYRPELFARCLASIRKQQHKELRIIVAYDDDRALQYIPDNVERIRVTPNREFPYYWNLYCNELKAAVTDGWFFFLDDDDFIIDEGALRKMNRQLEDIDPSEGVICQFLRWGRTKPNSHMMDTAQIVQGMIGMPCIFLHASQKDVVMFDGYRAADFRFIQSVSEKITLNFIKLLIVKTDRIGRGKPLHDRTVQSG